MNINNILRSKNNNGMKLIGMTLVSAFVGFIAFYDTSIPFSIMGLIIGVVFSFLIFKIMAVRENKKNDLELDEIQYYDEDELDLNGPSDKYDENEFV